MIERNDISFRPNARLILQLGDQLIRSESIAALELIKNSYDACATKVIINIANADRPEFGHIIIEDDGFGMDFNTIRNVWLHPGTTFKKQLIEKENYHSPCGRLPIGEKGIGRFGVHKLGKKIELISRTAESNEAVLTIDWNDFDNDKLLAEIPIQLTEREPKVFTGGRTGTKIIIQELNTKWTRGGLRELHRAVNSLNSPFETLNKFKVHFKTDRPEWLDGLMKFRDIEDSSLFKADVIIDGNTLDLEYDFTPWPSMNGIEPRHYEDRDVFMTQKIYDDTLKKRVMKDIDLSNYRIGKVRMKLLIFDLDTNILSLGVQDKKGLKDYLRNNGGVRVYREGIRVYDYGEPGNDWLNLDIERVNLPTARISNNIVIGAIQLDRLASRGLEEKTNREGFKEDDAYREFLASIRFAIGRIVTQRNIDKDTIRSFYGKKEKVTVEDNLSVLESKIDSILPQSEDKKAIIRIIHQIRDDYKTITEVYLRSASGGLSLSIVIHEVEKIIAELIYVVDETKSSEQVRNLTKHLGKLIEGYSGLIRKRSRKSYDLVDITRNAVNNVAFRLKAHNIHVVRAFDKPKNFDVKAKCDQSLITGTIVNLIDNSIWWLEYGKGEEKKIWINVTDERPEYLTVIVADNGPGFNLPTEQIIKPFISNKDGGIGIGLHLAYEIMNTQGGELSFPSADEFKIPTEFHDGAIVALSFKL